MLYKGYISYFSSVEHKTRTSEKCLGLEFWGQQFQWTETGAFKLQKACVCKSIKRILKMFFTTLMSMCTVFIVLRSRTVVWGDDWKVQKQRNELYGRTEIETWKVKHESSDFRQNQHNKENRLHTFGSDNCVFSSLYYSANLENYYNSTTTLQKHQQYCSLCLLYRYSFCEQRIYDSHTQNAQKNWCIFQQTLTQSYTWEIVRLNSSLRLQFTQQWYRNIFLHIGSKPFGTLPVHPEINHLFTLMSFKAWLCVICGT